MGLMTRAPSATSTLVKTLHEVAASYDMRVEHLFYAALRSYQAMHLNYFEELEEAAIAFRNEQGWRVDHPIDQNRLRAPC
jgi:hypothetical protein